jgi:hypothetical protein
VFENRELRRIFGSKGDVMIAGRTQLHNEELHKMYSSPSTTRMMKSRGMRWTGHVAETGTKGMYIGF